MPPPLCPRCRTRHLVARGCPVPRSLLVDRAIERERERAAEERSWLHDLADSSRHLGRRCGYTPGQGRYRGLSCISPPHSTSEHHRFEEPAPAAPTAGMRDLDAAEVERIRRSAGLPARPPPPPPPAPEAPPTRPPPDDQAQRNVEALRRRARRLTPPPADLPPPPPPAVDDASARFSLLELDLEPLAGLEPATAVSPPAPGADDSAARFSLLELD